MKTHEMLCRLQFSRNELTASVAKRILDGYETIAEAKQRNYGGFMQAVLLGQYDEAMCLADLDNQRCLAEEYSIEKETYYEL